MLVALNVQAPGFVQVCGELMLTSPPAVAVSEATCTDDGALTLMSVPALIVRPPFGPEMAACTWAGLVACRYSMVPASRDTLSLTSMLPAPLTPPDGVLRGAPLPMPSTD